MLPLAAEDPQQIGPYRITARLGAGGMGTVYFGRSPSGRPVAVKVLHGPLAADETFRMRFRREVSAMSAVSGAFTAPVIDSDLDGVAPWLATSYIPGPSLAEALEKAGPLPESSAMVLASGLGEALRNNQGTTGASLGKYIPGIRLIAADTMRPIGFWACLARQLCHGLDSLSLGIGYIAPLWTSKRQTFADMAMNTVVIQGPVPEWDDFEG